MKKNLFLAILLVLFAAASCSSYEKAYPLKTCLVSDNELGSMGDVVSLVYQGQEIKLCCSPCIKKFNKEPEKYMQKLKSLTESTKPVAN